MQNIQPKQQDITTVYSIPYVYSIPCNAFHHVMLCGRTYYIPVYMADGIESYIRDGVPPGDFLMAVLSNDLQEAYIRADDENFHNIPAYMNYFYNKIPAFIWGSRKKVESWIEKKYQERTGENKKEK